MSEIDAMATLQANIEAKVNNSEEPTGEPEVETDTTADDSPEEPVVDVEGETTSDDGSDEPEGEPDPDPEVEFNFHNTSTSIQKLVSNLKNLSPEDRKERISKISKTKGRERELEAVKEAFPDALKEDAPVSREELNALNKKFEELSKLANPEELQKALDIASKLNATEGLTDTRMKDLMLQEQFGDAYADVKADAKFQTAYEKFPSLTIEEKLEYACSLSPVARKLVTDSEVQSQLRLQNTKTVSKGKQKSSPKKEMKVNNLADFEKKMSQKFDG